MCSLATTVSETVITQNLQSAYGVRVALQIILFYTWLGYHRLGYVACCYDKSRGFLLSLLLRLRQISQALAPPFLMGGPT